MISATKLVRLGSDAPLPAESESPSARYSFLPPKELTGVGSGEGVMWGNVGSNVGPDDTGIRVGVGVGLGEGAGAVGIGLRVAVVTLEVSAVELELPPHAAISNASATAAMSNAGNVRKLNEKDALEFTCRDLAACLGVENRDHRCYEKRQLQENGSSQQKIRHGALSGLEEQRGE